MSAASALKETPFNDELKGIFYVVKLVTGCISRNILLLEQAC